MGIVFVINSVFDGCVIQAGLIEIGNVVRVDNDVCIIQRRNSLTFIYLLFYN